nr:MAG TPA: hypothetical protein [Caudoviricetes sp.]
MEHITKQEDVTVTRIVNSLNTLDDENMVVVSTTEPEKKKDGLIWVNPNQEEAEKLVYVGHTVGDIYPISYTELDSGQLILNGQLISREIYGVLWDWLQKHPSLIKTEVEWNAYLASTNNVCCPYFSVGTTETNFRLPKYSGVFIRADSDITKINQFSEDTQRNILGQFTTFRTSWDDGTGELLFGVSGAFAKVETGNNMDSIHQDSSDRQQQTINFDASRSVGAEHTGEEVKLKSINQIWVIQAVGTITNQTSIDVRTIQEEVQQLMDFGNYQVACIKDKSNYFSRDSLFTSNKTSIVIPKNMRININGEAYISTHNVTLNTSTLGENLAGKDVYIYALAGSGTEPDFVLSLNSTVPTGYTAENSRKIGGFHCLCKDVGIIEGHALSGYVAGDILPATRWDLEHRPKGSPEGFAYEELTDCWIAIYLPSWDGTKLVSVYNGVIADGSSAKKWHGEAFYEQFVKQGMRLVWRHEFQMGAKGSNERTNVQGSSDLNTTGGHVDTAGRRMISNIGLEDCCGVLWQFAMDLGFAGGSGWTNSVYHSAVDDRNYGQTYGTLYRLLLGSRWSDGAACGSRSADCGASSANVAVYRSSRGASEPRIENLRN